MVSEPRIINCTSSLVDDEPVASLGHWCWWRGFEPLAAVTSRQDSDAFAFRRSCSASQSTIGVFPVPPVVRLPTLITIAAETVLLKDACAVGSGAQARNGAIRQRQRPKK